MCAGGKIFNFKNTLETTKIKDISRTSLDLVFVVDCTASMDVWINTAKKEIKNIIHEVEKTMGSDVRFGNRPDEIKIPLFFESRIQLKAIYLS